MPVTITSRLGAQKLLRMERPPFTHLIGIGDAKDPRPVRGHEKIRDDRKLLLFFDDVETNNVSAQLAGYVPPAEEDVRRIIEFAQKIRPEANLLIHCEQGISRSTAAGLIILAIWYGAGREQEAARHVLKVRPQAQPNKLMVEMADRMLNRGGALQRILG